MSDSPNFRRGAVAPMECLQAGWELIRKDLLLYVGFGIIVTIVSGAIPIVLQGPMLCGLFMCLAQSARGESPTFEILFKGFDKFVPCLIVAAVQFVAALVVMIPMLFIIGGLALAGASSGGEPGFVFFLAMCGYPLMFLIMIAVQAVFLFAYPILANNDVDGLEAVKMSIAAVRGNLSGVLLLILLNTALGAVALMVCCIPILVAIPLMYASYFAAYQRIFDDTTTAGVFE